MEFQKWFSVLACPPFKAFTHHQSQWTIHSLVRNRLEEGQGSAGTRHMVPCVDCASEGTFLCHTLHRPWNGYLGMFIGR